MGTLLRVNDLRTSFFTSDGEVRAVDGVTFDIEEGKTMGLVGESGCGKSVTALSILGLIPQPPGRITGGEILFRESPDSEPADLLSLPPRQLQAVRGRRIAMIFQEPMTSFNPVFTVGRQIVEAVELHQSLRGKEARQFAIDLLARVGINEPQRRIDDHPHEMSGGMVQRAMIAMALAGDPSLLIADEPTTALDVTIQRHVLDLLAELREERGMSVLLISHDLGVVGRLADFIYIMYAGRIVEHAPANKLLTEPMHPYTRQLLRCTPRLADPVDRLEVIAGSVPHPSRWPSGCRFHPRCVLTAERAALPTRSSIHVESFVGDRVLHRCVETLQKEPSGVPPLTELAAGHYVACWEADADHS